ncbi:MAG: hypothetical protein ACTS4V_01435 [Candidatus Hodgkinia cicadicola]
MKLRNWNECRGIHEAATAEAPPLMEAVAEGEAPEGVEMDFKTAKEVMINLWNIKSKVIEECGREVNIIRRRPHSFEEKMFQHGDWLVIERGDNRHTVVSARTYAALGVYSHVRTLRSWEWYNRL